jgi:hypothetical protein
VTITGTSEQDRIAELERWGFTSDEELQSAVAAIAYFTLTLRHVFGEPLWRATMKGIVICAVYGTVTAMATASVVALSIFT